MKRKPHRILFLLCALAVELWGAMPGFAQGKDTTLVAHWNFDDGTARDNTGNGHDGKIFGNPAFVPGPCGQALAFNGIDTYIRIPNSPKLRNMTRMTLCYWIKFFHDDPLQAGNSIGNGSDDLPPTPGFYTYTGAGEISHFLGLQPNGRGIRMPYDATVPLNRQEFSFIVFMVTQDSLKAYRNGCLFRAVSRDGWNLARDWDWFIGWSGDVGGDSKFLEGMMDEIRIYDRPLGEGELFDLYTSCGGEFLTPRYDDVRHCPGSETTIEGTVTGGTPPYTYSWSPSAGLDSDTASTPIAAPQSTTTYTLTVTDLIGCRATRQITVNVEPCDTGIPNDTFRLSPVCPGTRNREHVFYRDTGMRADYSDTIVDVRFEGEDASYFRLDTLLPVIAVPTSDLRIPVTYRGASLRTHQAVMRLQSSQGLVRRIRLVYDMAGIGPPMISITTVNVAARNRTFDTCITLTSIFPVQVNLTDTILIGSGPGPQIFSPPLPVSVPAGSTREFCLRIPAGSGKDTLIFGAETADNEYPMCISHMIVINRRSTLGAGTTGEEEGEGNETLAKAFLRPNPASDRVTLRFTLARGETVAADITDTRGRMVGTIIAPERLEPGEHEASGDLHGLEPGVYFVRIVAEGRSRIFPLTIVR